MNTERPRTPLDDPHECDSLLVEFVLARRPLPELAAAHGLTLAALLDWVDEPRNRRLILALERAAELQARVATALARPAAIGTLLEHLEAHRFDEHHQNFQRTVETASVRARQRESARRAAAALLRGFGTRVEPRSPAGTPSGPSRAPAPAPEPVNDRAPLKGSREEDLLPAPVAARLNGIHSAAPRAP